MKGSFTGAVADRAGKFEQADGGTLFLDEIGDMSLAAQAKVLRVLQDGVVTRIGGAKPIEVDVRVLVGDEQEPRGGDRRGTLPRGPLLSAERRSDPRSAAARAARGHSRCWHRISCARCREREGVPPRVLRPDAVETSSRTSTGRATCASCATRSSDCSSCRRARASASTDVERLVGRARCRQRGSRLAARVQDVRGVQARGRAGVPAREAARVRLERVGDGARPRHAAVESVQEDRALRPDERDCADEQQGLGLRAEEDRPDARGCVR